MPRSWTQWQGGGEFLALLGESLTDAGIQAVISVEVTTAGLDLCADDGVVSGDESRRGLRRFMREPCVAKKARPAVWKAIARKVQYATVLLYVRAVRRTKDRNVTFA